MTRSLALIGAPTSAGAFAPGQEMAPAALRDAALVDRLRAGGIDVVDFGDLPLWRWRPDRANRSAQNLEVVVARSNEVAAQVCRAVERGCIPSVLGGDCTIEVGVVAGHLMAGRNLGLLYFDLHPDLNVPSSASPGALDWMGMAHLLGEELAAEPLSHLGPRFPLLENRDVYFFAWGPDQATAWEREVMKRRRLEGIAVSVVASDPEAAARSALDRFATQHDRFLVHFDVDTIDFTDCPLSENTGRNVGLSFDSALRALKVLVASERFAGLTITELNPAHGAADGGTVRRFVEALVDALSAAPALR